MRNSFSLESSTNMVKKWTDIKKIVAVFFLDIWFTYWHTNEYNITATVFHKRHCFIPSVFGIMKPVMILKWDTVIIEMYTLFAYTCVHLY